MTTLRPTQFRYQPKPVAKPTHAKEMGTARTVCSPELLAPAAVDQSPPDQPAIVPPRDGLTHPIPIGTEVAIFRGALSGLPYIEGRAVVCSFTKIPNFYRVQFLNEPTTYLRFVFPEMQHEPVALERALATLWRNDGLNGACFDDFFPDDLRDDGDEP